MCLANSRKVPAFRRSLRHGFLGMNSWSWMTKSAVLARAGLAIALVAQFGLVGCANKNKDEPEYVELAVEEIYEAAYENITRGRYERAAIFFQEVERQHPYSIWARRAMIMSAFSYYQANEYDGAINAADRFLALHPGNKDAPYAYYLKALCAYERISDVGREQEQTLMALNGLQEVVRRYPTTEYARDARLKIDLTRDHLAGKEMNIGRFYLKRNQYVSAVGRFKNVVETYQTTNHVPEALHRLTESYYALGLDDEAQAAAAVLGYNFPDSEWYRFSYALLRKHGADDELPKDDNGNIIERTLRSIL